jgi:leukotriene-A4 hydrolase
VTRPDPHSFFDPAQPRVRHLEWQLRLDFESQILVAEARLWLERGNGSTTPALLDLDTRELVIERVSDDEGAPLPYELSAPHPFLGQRLRISLRDDVTVLRIRYRTSPASPALQWSNQLVYSQCQPTYARALVPLPDSPSSRITFQAQLTAPRRPGWLTLMAATNIEQREQDDVVITSWQMVKPIPPHLIALASGEISLAAAPSPRVRIWSAQPLTDAARQSLVDVEALLAAAEALFGPYRWGNFHLLVMPPSFPHGGMENPGLAFLSPSLIGSDAALQVIAHELAHAWTGNLVSNASLEHFWINEGFTVYAERRILEAVAGRATAELHAALGRRELERALAAFAARPELTRLRTTLDAIDPEEALSIVPYEKGYLLLCAIEAAAGREELDRFLRALVEHFAFTSITTEMLRDFAEPRLRQWFNNWDEWLNHSNLPSSAPPSPLPPPPTELPDQALARHWSALQWRWFLDGLPRPWPHCAPLEQWFNNLPQASDPDLRAAFIALSIESDHPLPPALLDAALASGRLKELRPIYLALARHPSTRGHAGEIYRRHKDGYHPAARRQLERLLRDFGVATHVANPLSLGKRRT